MVLVTGCNWYFVDCFWSFGFVGWPGEAGETETASRWKRMERNHADFFASSSERSKHLGSCCTCFQAALWLHVQKKKRDHSKSLKIATWRLLRTCVPEFHDQASETLATLALKPRWGKIWHVQHFFNRVTCVSRMKRLYCGLPNCTKGIVIWCHILYSDSEDIRHLNQNRNWLSKPGMPLRAMHFGCCLFRQFGLVKNLHHNFEVLRHVSSRKQIPIFLAFLKRTARVISKLMRF